MRFTLKRSALVVGVIMFAAPIFFAACGEADTTMATVTADASTDAANSTCPAPLTQCGAACTNTSLDSQNCGACGKPCATGFVCALGTCAFNCPDGTTKCGSNCVDMNADDQNCSACGYHCPDGFKCQTGKCGEVCAPGLSLCPAWSGFDAGIPDAAAPNDAASDGAISDAMVADSSFPSPQPTCVDPQIDSHNCGACGNACSKDQACYAGACAYATSCSDLLYKKGPLADGEYTLDPDGSGSIKPFSVWCANMSTPTPKEYLTLAHSALTGEANSNFSEVNPGGNCSAACEPYYRQFSRVRIDIAKLQVDASDLTFAFARDNTLSACWAGLGGACGGQWAINGYGSAWDCVGGGSASGQAQIDLRDTPFSIDPAVTFTPEGFIPAGSSAFNVQRTTVSITGGGDCGGNAPSVPFQLVQN